MNNKQAFTLIELLVVVLIIGILAAVALPQYQKAVLKSKLAEVVLFQKNAMMATDAWVLENGYPQDDYHSFIGPDADASLDIDLTSGLDCSGTSCTKNNFVYDVYAESSDGGYWGSQITNSGASADSYLMIVFEHYADGRINKGCSTNYDEGLKICKALHDLDDSYTCDNDGSPC